MLLKHVQQTAVKFKMIDRVRLNFEETLIVFVLMICLVGSTELTFKKYNYKSLSGLQKHLKDTSHFKGRMAIIAGDLM